MKRAYYHHRGFTLLELLIAVAIVGILASLAYNGYQDSILKSRRAECQQQALFIQNRLEKYSDFCHTYTTNLGGIYPATCPPEPAGAGLGLGAGAFLTDNGHYRITINLNTIAGTVAGDPDNALRRYTVSCDPTDAATTRAQAVDDACLIMRVDSTNAKTATGSLNTRCWTK
ncbi:MAG: hypothetical protein BMS9Abin36_1371 [Gammaproteobacteria bacterium]|nr:MAG: hypothetical protein BMS9Abin36_1371 [Gammaproteobacteria bacterium]